MSSVKVYIKGNVQRKLTGLESGISRKVATIFSPHANIRNLATILLLQKFTNPGNHKIIMVTLLQIHSDIWISVKNLKMAEWLRL
jgi:hypothetical protein